MYDAKDYLIEKVVHWITSVAIHHLALTVLALCLNPDHGIMLDGNDGVYPNIVIILCCILHSV